jgi:programmed cell death protein 5
VRIVKGEKAKKVEDMLINMATKGQLQEVVDENGIKKLLEQMSEVSAAPKVAIRRRAFDDDDW